MARKQPRLQRVLDAPALASVAYGEIASSIYFALGIVALHALGFNPWDLLVAMGSIVAVAVARAFRRPAVHTFGIVVPVLDLVTQLLLVGVGFAVLFSPHALTMGTSLGSSPSWHAIAFAFPLAMLAYTGLETVANFAEEVRRPGRDLPRSLFSAVGLVVVIYVLIALVALSAFPARGGTTALGTTWFHAPLVGIVSAFHGHLPAWFQSMLRVYVGITGALVLLAAATTSISGFGRLAYSLGEHGQLPAPFGRLNRRTLVAPVSIASAAAVSVAILGATSLLHDRVSFLASLFSFGVLLAFTSAQLAVIRLRMTRPDLRRPFRVPFEWRGMPVPSVVGALATAAVFVDAMVTHRGARYGGPVWLLIGLAVYLMVRRERGAGLLEPVRSADEQVLPEAEFSRILVPMKLGEIGEEMVATAVKLAQERAAAVDALYVIQVPLDQPLDAELTDAEERAAASIGQAIVEQARERDADLIVLGSAPRWRRQSRFFSPTVDYVLRKAPCEVLIVAFPQGVLEGDGAGT